jgi:hypothetical protein
MRFSILTEFLTTRHDGVRRFCPARQSFNYATSASINSRNRGDSRWSAFPRESRRSTFNWPTTPAFPAGPTAGNSATQLYSGLGSVTISNVAVPSTGAGAAWTTGYPQVNATSSTGGNFPAVNGLQLNIGSQSSVNRFIKIAINFGFTGGATNVSFTLWDVDASAGTFKDAITNIVGITSTGTQVAATVTNIGLFATNTVTGSGTLAATATGTSSNGQNSGNGNVTISFGSATITSVEFRYTAIRLSDLETVLGAILQ